MSDHHHHDTQAVETSSGLVFALVAIVALVLAAVVYFAARDDGDGDVQIDVDSPTPTTQQDG